MLTGAYRIFAALLVASLFIAACGSDRPQDTIGEGTPVPLRGELILATTTSTQDSGLLDVLLPLFERRTGWRVKPIAVGSGQAMTMGRRGDADVLLVHSPDAEKQFMDEGYGNERLLVMHNDFIVVGPPSDPAGMKHARTTLDAMRAIDARGAPFISRADNSGTHTLELKLWALAGIHPTTKSWYQEVGQGMGATLQIADQRDAYTIADRGTYLALRHNYRLQVLNEGDAVLLNVYHVVTLNPDRQPGLNHEGAEAFARFLVSREAQEVIRTYGVDRFGEPLFVPDAGKTLEQLGIQ